MSNVSKSFRVFIQGQDADERSALRDVLTDIIHMCEENGYDFSELLKGAGEVANEEEGEEEKG